jgi:hypothetical protein
MRSLLPRFLALLVFATDPEPVQASTVVHTVLGGPSAITGTYGAILSVTVNTNLGALTTPQVALLGSFTDTTAKPTGAVNVDWGSPAWNDSLAMGFDVTGSNLGSVSSATSVGFSVPLIGTVGVPITLGFRVDSFSIETVPAFAAFVGATTPDDGGNAGPGPWSAADDPLLQFTGSLTFPVTLPFGLGTVNIPLGAGSRSANVPVDLALSREGGNPGTGSRAVIDLGPVSGFADRAFNFTQLSSGCEVLVPVIGTCAFDISSYVVRVSAAGVDDIGAHIEATQSGAQVPEPSTALLLALGLASLAVRARVRR